MVSAATTLVKAKGQPSIDALTSTLSTPVCGVATKKPTAAPSLAPSALRLTPAGMTPHEHSGSGTPSATALSTPLGPCSCRRMRPGGKMACSRPATAAPSSSQGASSVVTDQTWVR